MKTVTTLLLLCLFISCKQSNTETSENETKESSISKAETSKKGGALIQKGDYSALFERDAKNCDFINTESISKALGVSSSLIAKENNNCAYTLTEANRNKTSFHFTVQKWNNKQVLKEIKAAKKNAETFGKDSKISQYRISETGDTYLSMHQNRMLRILNENANNTIILYYKTEISPQEKDVEKINMLKDKALEHSYAIANYIVNTHKQ